jgi:hypothetical protein
MARAKRAITATFDARDSAEAKAEVLAGINEILLVANHPEQIRSATLAADVRRHVEMLADGLPIHSGRRWPLRVAVYFDSLANIVQARVKHLNQTPFLRLHSSNWLSVYLQSPYWAYRTGVAEASRKREALSSVYIPPGVQVQISPSTIDAPDIMKLVLERDGKEVVPIANELKPATFTTRLFDYSARRYLSGVVPRPRNTTFSGGRTQIQLLGYFVPGTALTPGQPK